MPLSPPVGRQHLHTRKVTCQGFYRDDGLYDIEGHITDEKTYEHANEWRGSLQPGDFVHDMSDPPHDRPSLHHRRRRSGDRQVAIPDVRRHHAELQEADRAAHRRRLHPRRPRAAGRHRGLHPYRRIAGPGRHDGVPDRRLAQGARPRDGVSDQDRQAAAAASIRPSRNASPTCSTAATPGRRTARSPGAGCRSSTLAPMPRRCERRRRTKKSRWTADLRWDRSIRRAHDHIFLFRTASILLAQDPERAGCSRSEEHDAPRSGAVPAMICHLRPASAS